MKARSRPQQAAMQSFEDRSRNMHDVCQLPRVDEDSSESVEGKLAPKCLHNCPVLPRYPQTGRNYVGSCVCRRKREVLEIIEISSA